MIFLKLCAILDRKKVLQHHPDKKGSKKKQFDVPGLNQHEYFTCITKAYEILSNVVTRRAYDSIDPTFNDDVPTTVKGDFFETFGSVFERNARQVISFLIQIIVNCKFIIIS